MTTAWNFSFGSLSVFINVKEVWSSIKELGFGGHCRERLLAKAGRVTQLLAWTCKMKNQKWPFSVVAHLLDSAFYSYAVQMTEL